MRDHPDEVAVEVVIPAEAEPRMPSVVAECPTPWAEAAERPTSEAAEHPILLAAHLMAEVAGRRISAAAVRASAVGMSAAHPTSQAGRRHRILRHARTPVTVIRLRSTPAEHPGRP
jgi:hypothetical protein